MSLFSQADAKVLWGNFITKIAEDPASVRGMIGEYVRTYIKQEGVARRAFSPETITTAELDVNPDGDIPIKWYGKEKDVKAVSLTFRSGKAGVEYYTTEKFPITFFKIESEHYRKNVPEIQQTLIPINEVLKKNIVYKIQEEEDKRFKKLLEAAVTTTANVVPSGLPNLSKEHITEITKMAAANRGRIAKLIMTEDRFQDVLLFDANSVGHNLVQEMFIDGYKYKQIFGIPVITTNATDTTGGVWNSKEIWAIPDKQYMGYFKIYIPKGVEIDTFTKVEGDEIEFWSWEYPAFGIGNINYIIKGTLT